MCNSVRLVLMNASLINSKQVENDITKTLRDFFSQVTETPTSKEFSIKNECTNSFLRRLHESISKRVGFAKNNLKNVT